MDDEARERIARLEAMIYRLARLGSTGWPGWSPCMSGCPMRRSTRS